jgi:hypothetical protein
MIERKLGPIGRDLGAVTDLVGVDGRPLLLAHVVAREALQVGAPGDVDASARFRVPGAIVLG